MTELSPEEIVAGLNEVLDENEPEWAENSPSSLTSAIWARRTNSIAAAISLIEAMAWRPIAEANMHKQEVITLEPIGFGGFVKIAPWNDEKKQHDYGDNVISQPTHFIPLSALPKLEA